MDEDKKRIILRAVIWFFYAAVAAGVFTGRWFAAGYSGGANALYDCFFVAGMVVLLIGALTLLAYFGAFDIFSYSFGSRLTHMRSNENVSRYHDYPAYIEEKKQKRKMNKPYFLPYVCIGGALLLTALVFYFVARSQTAA